VVEVPAVATHALRRAVLREGRADAVVVFEGDDEPTTVHLAVVDDDGSPVAVASLLVRPCPRRPDRVPARQLRGMAVTTDRQGEGLGARLLTAANDRCRAEGSAVLWAHARQVALGFYEAQGLRGEGEIYLHGDIQLPHRLVLCEFNPEIA